MAVIRALLAVVLAATCLAALTVQTSTAPAAAAQTKPNIVVIMVDDMREDDLAAMPQTKDWFLNKVNGARYNQHYASMPLCCPSRATFLTGQHAHNNGVWSNTGPHGGFNSFVDTDTLPVWLDNAGYQTVMTGKYLNGYGAPSANKDPDYVPPGWDHWAGLVGGSTYNYLNFDVNINGNIVHQSDDYTTWDTTGRAVNQINNRIGSDNPLFLWVSYVAPHIELPMSARPNTFIPVKPKYKGTSTVGAPDSQAFNEAAVADKPGWIKDRPQLTSSQVNDAIQLRRERRDALRFVDDGVNNIFENLQASGELSNTIVFFVSDNGFLLGEHRILQDKRFPYEESAKIPMLARGGGFNGKGQVNRLVSNVDLPATIAELADATPGHDLDGKSLLGANPPQGQWRPMLLSSPNDFGAKLPQYRGIRVGPWVLYDYGDPRITRELYNLNEDPDQTVNRIANPAYADARAELQAALDDIRDCSGSGCNITITLPETP